MRSLSIVYALHQCRPHWPRRRSFRWYLSAIVLPASSSFPGDSSSRSIVLSQGQNHGYPSIRSNSPVKEHTNRSVRRNQNRTEQTRNIYTSNNNDKTAQAITKHKKKKKNITFRLVPTLVLFYLPHSVPLAFVIPSHSLIFCGPLWSEILCK